MKALDPGIVSRGYDETTVALSRRRKPEGTYVGNLLPVHGRASSAYADYTYIVASAEFLVHHDERQATARGAIRWTRRLDLANEDIAPAEAVASVVDAQSFLRFVELLEFDRRQDKKIESESPSSPYSPGARGWQNGTIEEFLEAARAWAEDSHFGEDNFVSSDSIWRACAEFLLAGKHYE